ncbi:MAG: ABC transporter ATP-binding protein [Proteobacteria bacterium]|nr:ABC transporter ATP-binding protein [Pseudomonadota bacterium]
MPRTIMSYVLATTGLHQTGLAILSVALFGLSAVPLELQRRIVNGLTHETAFENIAWLALGYAGVALAEQLLKLSLNIYRGWVAESTVRRLRDTVCVLDPGAQAATAEGAGIEIAMVLEEAEPIGGFTGISISEPLLQGGILVSVVAYIFVLQPWLALLGLLFFLPQTAFVPLLQGAINRRARERILVKRDVSGTIADGRLSIDASPKAGPIQRIFSLNMQIYWFKYVMNLLMNLMYHLSVAVALCVGGWMVLQGRIEVGTVVAVAGGLGKLNDPWGDLVNWAREFSVVGVKYRLFADAVDWLGTTPTGQAAEGDALAPT